MDIRLVVMSVGFGLGIILSLALGIFVLIKSKRNTFSIIFFLIMVSVAIVEVSIVGTVTATSPTYAYYISFLQIINIYMVTFMAHWVIIAIGKIESRRIILGIIYFTAISLTVYFISDPYSFLLQPISKMYLNYYFVPGSMYTLMRVYVAIITLYFLAELFVAFRSTVDTVVRNRFRYVFWATIYGMVFGHFALFLVYDLEIDPVWSVLFPLYALPLAYSVVKYELMDIKIVAKRALVYGFTISFIAIILGLINSFSNTLTSNFQNIPKWLVPIATSFIASSLGFIIWFRLKESEVLKYEFITIVTHKFRAPLTRIKWAVDSLENEAHKSKEIGYSLNTISLASESLNELTNTLIKTTASEQVESTHTSTEIYIKSLIEKVIYQFRSDIERKNIKINIREKGEVPNISTHESSLTIVLQSIVENSIIYNRDSGEINIEISYTNSKIQIIVSDTGMGIGNDDLPRIFSKFYRSSSATHIDTEGLGISLYIAKQIADRNGWSLNVHSLGENRGCSFILNLPLKI